MEHSVEEKKQERTDRIELKTIIEYAPITKKRICDAIGYNELYFHQKILYFLLYPLICLLDIDFIRKRVWLQLPILTYFIEVTQLMMAITFVQVHIQSLETEATDNGSYETADAVAVWMLIYTLIIALICIICLFLLQPLTSSDHYSYFVELCAHLIGYGLLYLFVLIQYEWFSATASDAWLLFVIMLCAASWTIAAIIILKETLSTSEQYDDMTDLIISQYQSYSDLYKSKDAEQVPSYSNVPKKSNHLKHIESNEELTDSDDCSEMMTLIPTQLSRTESSVDPYCSHLEFSSHQIECNNFAFTIFFILQKMWYIPAGFILVECIVYIFINDYVDLLVQRYAFTEQTVILDDDWKMIVFGMALAVATAIFEAFMELRCKIPCYQFLENAKKSHRSDCYHRFVVFVLNWLNEISILWFEILAACIGWSLLPPNQAKNMWDQLAWAICGTLLLGIVGVCTQRWKNLKHKNVMRQIEKIKHEQVCVSNKEQKLFHNMQRIIFYARMIRTFNAAVAVSVSFVWESFIQLTLEGRGQGLTQLEDHWQILLRTIAYAVCIGFAFTQLGLLLTDLRKQRVYESHLRNHANEI